MTGGFSAKNQCDRRKYEYVVPVRTFDVEISRERKRAERKNENEDCGKEKSAAEGAEDTTAHADAKDRDDGTEEEKRKEQQRTTTTTKKKKKRERKKKTKNRTSYELERTSERRYGNNGRAAHNFHNYATKVDCDTPQARRFVISFSCSMPFKIQANTS